MSKRTMIFGVLAWLSAVSALAQGQAPAQPEGTAGAADEVRPDFESCRGYKLEIMFETVVDGAARQQRARMCDVEAKNDADWIRTLSDTIAKVQANDKLSADAKVQLVTALQAEILKFTPATPGQASAGVAQPTPIVAPAPEPSPPAIAAAPPPPAPAPVASAPPSRLRLTVRCLSRGSGGDGGNCSNIEGDTLIVVRADEALHGGAGLRFLRRGDARGEIIVPPLGQGETQRFALPRQLCAGVNTSRVQIQVVDRAGAGNNGRVVDTLGPFPLRC